MKLNWLHIRDKFKFKTKKEAAEFFNVPYSTFFRYCDKTITTEQQDKIVNACLDKRISVNNIFNIL